MSLPDRGIYRNHGKRMLDVLGAFAGLLILSPVLLVLFVLVRLSVGSPVVFRQTRPGYKGRLFTIYKFRTMTNARDEGGNLLPDERRITTVGRLLRSSSLDELPELFNVLKGDMSIVGPRPLLPQYLGRYSPEQARRHDVIPGITGWSQINGRNDQPWEKKLALDVWYVDHLSLHLDLSIIGLTAWKVLRRSGISREGYATAPEFMGNPKGE